MYRIVNPGEKWLRFGMVAKASGSAITTGTVNTYCKCVAGDAARLNKWFRDSDNSWQASETIALAATHQADGNWTVNYTNSPFTAGEVYLSYGKESGDLHVAGEGTLINCRYDNVNAYSAGGQTITAANPIVIYAAVGSAYSLVVDSGGRGSSDVKYVDGAAWHSATAGRIGANLTTMFDVATQSLTGACVNQAADSNVILAKFGFTGTSPYYVKCDVVDVDGAAFHSTTAGRLAANMVTMYDVATQNFTGASVNQGADSNTILSKLSAALVPVTGAVYASGDSTTTVFKTTLTSTVTDFWKGQAVVFTSGMLAGQLGQIKAYAAHNGTYSIITVQSALTSAPADNVTFSVVNVAASRKFADLLATAMGTDNKILVSADAQSLETSFHVDATRIAGAVQTPQDLGYNTDILIGALCPLPGTVDDAAATTMSFITDLGSSVNNFYRGLIVFTGGVLHNQTAQIRSYTGSSKKIYLVSPLTSAPGNGDHFIIVNTAGDQKLADVLYGAWGADNKVLISTDVQDLSGTLTVNATASVDLVSFFTDNTGKVFADAVSGSVVKEIATTIKAQTDKLAFGGTGPYFVKAQTQEGEEIANQGDLYGLPPEIIAPLLSMASSEDWYQEDAEDYSTGLDLTTEKTVLTHSVGSGTGLFVQPWIQIGTVAKPCHISYDYRVRVLVDSTIVHDFYMRVNDNAKQWRLQGLWVKNGETVYVMLTGVAGDTSVGVISYLMAASDSVKAKKARAGTQVTIYEQDGTTVRTVKQITSTGEERIS